MTSTLERAPISQESNADEDTPRWDVDMEDLAPETNSEVIEPSVETSLASQEPIDRATSRVGRFLQNTADRFENGAVHADNAMERAAELKERAKNALKKAGRAALSWGLRTGKATFELGVGATVLTAEAAGRGIKKVGTAVKDNYNDAKLRREVNKSHSEALVEDQQRTVDAQNDAFISYAPNIERSLDIDEAYDMNEEFDADQAEKQAAINKLHEKALGMNEKLDRRRARKAAALKRKAERRARWSAKWNTLKSTVASGAEVTGDAFMNGMAKVEKGIDWAGDKMLDAKDAVQDKTERAKRSIHISRAAGRAAIDAFRDTRTDLKINS